jgi:Terminase large subunit, T4likevirus-type, N-terminal
VNATLSRAVSHGFGSHQRFGAQVLPFVIPRRITPLCYHPTQDAWINSTKRFHVVSAGRRSGKTEIAKRKIVKRALNATGNWADPRFFAAAPTRDQAKKIFWQDLKSMIPQSLMRGKPLETELCITLITGVEVHVVGMDRPERIEGVPWDGGVLDEFANMKSSAWGANVRPALADRGGWCDLIGVPEGRNHYYDLWKRAISGIDPEWAGYTWPMADVQSAEEVESLRRTLDELTFQQECYGSFISFEGRAYYSFQEATHCAPLTYNPDAPLALCFDFNVEPGVAAIIQEQHLPNGMPEDYTGTGVIGEVYIPHNSNTPAVCRRVLQDWGDHRGEVCCYGDATGGARGTAQTEGSDWELIKQELRPVFGDRLNMRVGRSNPPERARINAVNSRLRAADGGEWLMVDPAKAPNVVRDFEGVCLLTGGSGELDKNVDKRLTHVSDAIGYYVHAEFPVVKPVGEMADMF